jgi:Pla-1/cef family extracellular lipase
MKKSLLSVSVFSLLGLTACGSDESLRDDPGFQPMTATPVEQPFVRVVFDPASGDLNIPNDLLMLPNGNFFDFTLNTEGSATFDPTNPQHALSRLDGWSVLHPMAIRVTLPEGMDVDPSSVNGTAIRLFEATQALQGTSAQCQSIAAILPAPGVPCEMGAELVYGVDFVASYTPNSGAITLLPLKVLKPAQGHILAVTDSLQDLTGRAVKGSGTWELVRQDIQTNQVGEEALVPLQQIVNYTIDLLQPAGMSRDTLSYSAYFSTQSITDVLSTIKALNITPYAQALQEALAAGSAPADAQLLAAQYLPNISTQLPETGNNAFETLGPSLLSAEALAQLSSVGLDTCDGLLTTLADPSSPLLATAAETFATVGVFCTATIVKGQVDLPYYLDPIAPNDGWWKAACTSSATLQVLGQEVVTGLIQTGQMGVNNTLCQGASNGQLFDLDLTSLGMDDPRSLTKFNPVPVPNGRQLDNAATLYNEAGSENIPVQFTLPNVAVVAALSAATNGAVPTISKPSAGWPVVLFQHGVTGSKENALAISAALSMAGIASAAIDLPLHGERGLLLADGSLINASVNGSTDYFNLGNLLVGRDNSRQSIADIVAFRLALNTIADTTGLVDLDTSNVHFIGQSLGAISGAGATAIANQTLGETLGEFDAMYAINSAVLNVPAGGTVTVLLESAGFGPLIKGSLVAGFSADFVDFLTQYAITNQLSLGAATGPAFVAFEQLLTAEQLASINSAIGAYAFPAQTLFDATDPASFAASLGESTQVLMHLVVGGGVNDDGSTGMTDQVVPVATSLPLAGGQALADLVGLPKVTTTSQGSGLVSFNAGGHGSLLLPATSAPVTLEMQSQAVGFVLSQGQVINVTNTVVVEN